MYERIAQGSRSASLEPKLYPSRRGRLVLNIVLGLSEPIVLICFPLLLGGGGGGYNLSDVG